jgi:hypothetical protein
MKFVVSITYCLAGKTRTDTVPLDADTRAAAESAALTQVGHATVVACCAREDKPPTLVPFYTGYRG